MGILVAIAVGVAAGWLWTSVPRPAPPIGAPQAAAFGAAGGLIGSFLSCALTHLPVSDLHLTTLLGSAIGAAAVLLVASRVSARQAARQAQRTQI